MSLHWDPDYKTPASLSRGGRVATPGPRDFSGMSLEERWELCGAEIGAADKLAAAGIATPWREIAQALSPRWTGGKWVADPDPKAAPPMGAVRKVVGLPLPDYSDLGWAEY